jgi:chromosome segregation ATPase
MRLLTLPALSMSPCEEERRQLMRTLEDMRRQQTALQSQFSRSRQDLLTQLEARLNSIEQLRSELDNEAKVGCW